MQNYIMLIDESGKVVHSEKIKSLLTNIQRFNIEFSEIRQSIKAIAEKRDIKALRILASDFYGTWYASNTELIKVIGLPKCIEYFVSFREYFCFTWPDDALDLIENNGMNATIQIFRGTSKALAKNCTYGLSWTTQRSIAEYYANRSINGIVLTAQVSMRDVLVYIGEEMEIIALPSQVKLAKCHI